MEKGDILGHEFMGEVVDLGSEVKNLKIGDRVVVPFTISCGSCFFCQRELYSCCDNSNPNAALAEELWGQSPSGLFGYSHMLGRFRRRPGRICARAVCGRRSDQGADGDLTDEQVLFLSDIFPTGYMAAENCNIQPGDTVAVWGCGPVGQFAIRSAYMLGAERVIAIDRFPERLRMAHDKGKARNHQLRGEGRPSIALKEMTGGRGPDSCIDAVGMEAHCHGFVGMYDKVKQAMMSETGRPIALREAIIACRKGGTCLCCGRLWRAAR